MLKHLSIRNFKSWQKTEEIPLAPLTGFFGPNSSGKTSLLQAILLLKQTTESADRKRTLHLGDEDSIVDVGTFHDIIHGHRQGLPLEFEISWDPSEDTRDQLEEDIGSDNLINGITFSTIIREIDGTPEVSKFRYEFDDISLGMDRKRNEDNEFIDEHKLTQYGVRLKRSRGRPWPLPEPNKCYGFPDKTFAYYQDTQVLADLVLALEELFNNVYYLGPLRKYPERSYVWAGERPEDVGERGGKAVPALLAGRSAGMEIPRGEGRGTRYHPIKEVIGNWLKKMDLIYDYSLDSLAENRKDYELKIRKTRDSSEVLITEVGFGVSQVLPVLVLCYYAPEGSTVILEQPEVHLHPSVQAVLADVFIDVIKNRGVQLIIESHSEHLLRRLQRRIAEKVIPNEKVSLYFTSLRGSISQIDRLQVDEYGNITNWPENFFGDEGGDLAAMTRAAMKRRQESEEGGTED